MTSKKKRPVKDIVSDNREKRLADRLVTISEDAVVEAKRRAQLLKRAPSGWPRGIAPVNIETSGRVVIKGLPGRPPGPQKRSSPVVPIVAGSLHGRLAMLDVGGYLYIECEPDRLLSLQSDVQKPVQRRPHSTKHMKFHVANYTAVGAKTGQDVRYLVRVERLA